MKKQHVDDRIAKVHEPLSALLAELEWMVFNGPTIRGLVLVDVENLFEMTFYLRVAAGFHPSRLPLRPSNIQGRKFDGLIDELEELGGSYSLLFGKALVPGAEMAAHLEALKRALADLEPTPEEVAIHRQMLDAGDISGAKQFEQSRWGGFGPMGSAWPDRSTQDAQQRGMANLAELRRLLDAGWRFGKRVCIDRRRMRRLLRELDALDRSEVNWREPRHPEILKMQGLQRALWSVRSALAKGFAFPLGKAFVDEDRVLSKLQTLEDVLSDLVPSPQEMEAYERLLYEMYNMTEDERKVRADQDREARLLRSRHKLRSRLDGTR